MAVAGLGLTGVVTLLGLGALCLSSGCASVGYLAQAAGGHLEMLRLTKPVDQWLSDSDVPDTLKQRLRLSQSMRDFASKTLHLPDNSSYRQYADLKRNAVVWNVVATGELSLTLRTWCFPLTGCIGYKGYFNEAGARQEAAQIRTEGAEVSVYGVPAYSTLGWFTDPLLNTFIRYPEGELARMMFHELAHQVVYVKDDTAFNESFATAVERLGGARWLAEHATPAAKAEYETFDARRRDFRAMTSATRARLKDLYASPLGDDQKRQQKQIIFDDMRAEHLRLKQGPWKGYAGYDRWVADANNPALAVMGAYNDGVAGFEGLFVEQGQDWPKFFAAVKALAAQPPTERQARLDALARAHAKP